MKVTRQIRRAEVRNQIKGRHTNDHGDKALLYFFDWVYSDKIPEDAPVEFFSCVHYYEKVMGF